jgi:hypothetical protein
MASLATIQLGNEKLTVKKSSGNFFETTKLWFDGTAGSCDFMKTLNKIGILCGNEHLVKQTGGYLVGTAVPRVYTSARLLYNTYATYKKDKVVSVWRIADISHQFCEIFRMSAYSAAFFKKNPATPLQAGTVLSVVSDATDVASCSAQINEARNRRLKLVTASPVIQRANTNALQNAVLKLIKAVTAFVASIFACYALVMGTTLVAPMLAVIVALSSSLFNIAAYYHKNYWCDTLLKVDYLPAKLA